MKFFIPILLIFQIVFTYGGLLPPGLTFCNKSDPKLNECIAKAATEGLKIFGKGVKSLGLYSLNPLKLEKIEIEDSSSKSISLQQKYLNINLYNLTDAEIKEAKVDFEKGTWSMRPFAKISEMRADYVMKGQILIFPVNAHGKCVVTLLNSNDSHDLKFEVIEKDGKKYMHVTEYKLIMNPEKVEYYFENIMPGNEQLSNELLKTINENSLSIFNDIKPGFQQVYSVIFKDIVNKIFDKVPMDEVFMP